jgi:hypothetical protein
MATPADTYQEGNVLKFVVTFTDEETGMLIDPSSIIFGYRINGGTINTFTYGNGQNIVRASLGTYSIKLDSSSFPGIWIWEWQSTGSGQAMVSGSLTVTPAPMSLA